MRLALFVIRKYNIKIDYVRNELSYDLTGKRKGPLVRYAILDNQSVDDAQKYLLTHLNSNYDLFRGEQEVLFGLKGNSVMQNPEHKAMLVEASNMYRMVIPTLPSDWLPSETTFNFIQTNVADLLWEYDKIRFAKYDIVPTDIRIVCPHNWLVTNKIYKERYDEKGFPTLVILCLRALSAYNKAYGGNAYYPNVSNAAFNPLIGLGERLSRLPKNYVGFLPGFSFNNVHRGLNFYYKHCVKLRKFRFTFDPKDLDLFKWNNSKCGYRKWPHLDPIKLDEFSTVVFTDKPNKRQAQRTLMKEFLESVFIALDDTACGLIPFEKRLKQSITTMSVKNQNLSPTDDGCPSDKSLKDMFHKSRLFFLSNDSQLHKFFLTRVKAERTYFPDCYAINSNIPANNMTVNISIGFAWIRGGAAMLFNALNGLDCDQYKRVSLPGDSPENVCCTYKWVSSGTQLIASGDIKSLDTSITAIPLVLYLMFAQVWILRDDSDPNYRMFQYILEACSEHLAGKTVRWLHDFILLIGVMPSGSLETSHGDSWIVGVIYWMSYIFAEMDAATRDDRRLIWKYLSKRMIAIFVYGDDFLKTYPRDIAHIVNVKRFAKYLEYSHGIQMKNMEEFQSLKSYYRVVANEIVEPIYRGPSYLKRQFLDSANFNLEQLCPKIAPIVSYRPFPQYQWRAGVPKDRDAPIYVNLARLLGLVYDTLGIDPISYHFLEYLYQMTYRISEKLVGRAFIEANMRIWIEQDSKYLNKINYKLPHYNFPTRAELLSLNILDREYHYPRNVGTWQQHLVDDTWW